MSHKATSWAWSQKLPAMQKFVLLALADRHNSDTGRCDPSMKRVADDCGMSRESVKRAVRELQKAGLIEAHQRFNGTANISNFYTLSLDGVGSDRPHLGSDRPRGRVTQTHEPVIESVIELKPSPQNGKTARFVEVNSHIPF